MAKDKVSKSQGGHASPTHRDLLIDDVIPCYGKRDGNKGHRRGRGVKMSESGDAEKSWDFS